MEKATHAECDCTVGAEAGTDTSSSYQLGQTLNSQLSDSIETTSTDKYSLNKQYSDLQQYLDPWQGVLYSQWPCVFKPRSKWDKGLPGSGQARANCVSLNQSPGPRAGVTTTQRNQKPAESDAYTENRDSRRGSVGVKSLQRLLVTWAPGELSPSNWVHLQNPAQAP